MPGAIGSGGQERGVHAASTHDRQRLSPFRTVSTLRTVKRRERRAPPESARQFPSRWDVALDGRAPYCDCSRKNFRPTLVGTVVEILPALVTAVCTAGVQEFGRERSMFS